MEKRMLSDRTGREIARILEVKYGGIQEGFKGIPGFYLFIDPVTGTSFAGTDLEDTRQGLQDERIAFGKE